MAIKADEVHRMFIEETLRIVEKDLPKSNVEDPDFLPHYLADFSPATAFFFGVYNRLQGCLGR